MKVINTRSTPLTLEGFYYVDEEDKNEYHAYSNIKLRDELYETAFWKQILEKSIYSAYDSRYKYKISLSIRWL